MAKHATRSSSTLRAPYDLDRRNGHCMEAAHFRSFYHLEPDIRSDHDLDLNMQYERAIESAAIMHADSPDFRIRLGNHIIGVEIRRLFISPDGPALESTRESILNEACDNAERLNLPPADVTLFFNLCRPLRAADRRRIADALVKVVADNMPVEGDVTQLEHEPGQPFEVDLIQINRRSHREVGRWRADFQFSKIETNVFNLVQNAISEKVKRLPTYLKFCDECWLLLVADSFEASGNLRFGNVGQQYTFSSPFTRTYALDFGRGSLHRLG